MKLSVLTNLYGAKSLEETLQILTSMDIHTVELGAGKFTLSSTEDEVLRL